MGSGRKVESMFFDNKRNFLFGVFVVTFSSLFVNTSKGATHSHLKLANLLKNMGGVEQVEQTKVENETEKVVENVFIISRIDTNTCVRNIKPCLTFINLIPEIYVS